MQAINEIANYVSQNTRNKIVFCANSIDELKFVDIGYTLSKMLEDNWENKEASITQLFVTNETHNNIGKYFAIKNVGILFEPELKLNIHDILESYSKNQCLIIQTDSELFELFNLQGLSYKTLSI